MNHIESAIYEIHSMDSLASRNQWVNQLHPLIKFITTIVYITATVSFAKYDVLGTASMIIYPLVIFQLADLSFFACVKRLRIVLPLVCCIGIFNPFFDHATVPFCGVLLPAGVLSMCTLIMKGVFSVLASYLLIATTCIEDICYALRLLHIPKLLVTQILLTYRYVTVLLEEVNRMTQAYSLRAPRQTGVHFRVWGSLTGQLLLRSIDRANAVYESMLLRGYQGDFSYIRQVQHLHKTDVLYLLLWLIIFFACRSFPIFALIGQIFGGIF